jgi:hypothetical protein
LDISGRIYCDTHLSWLNCPVHICEYIDELNFLCHHFIAKRTTQSGAVLGVFASLFFLICIGSCFIESSCRKGTNPEKTFAASVISITYIVGVLVLSQGYLTEYPTIPKNYTPSGISVTEISSQGPRDLYILNDATISSKFFEFVAFQYIWYVLKFFMFTSINHAVKGHALTTIMRFL